jgi:single-strand DNA-binding protein
MASTAVTIYGNLTSDPELKYFTGGTPKLEFSIAANETWTDKDGERQEKTSFFDVVAWRNLAEDSANILEKGMGVIIVGRLEQQTWEDKETGAKRSRVNVLADRIGANVGSLSAITRKSRSDAEGGAKKFPAKASPSQQLSKKVVEDDEPF